MSIVRMQGQISGGWLNRSGCCKIDTTKKYQYITATVFLLAGFATIRATMIGWFSYAQSDKFSIWPAARAAPLGGPGARLGRRG
jgi:hypothetical protein